MPWSVLHPLAHSLKHLSAPASLSLSASSLLSRRVRAHHQSRPISESPSDTWFQSFRFLPSAWALSQPAFRCTLGHSRTHLSDRFGTSAHQRPCLGNQIRVILLVQKLISLIPPASSSSSASPSALTTSSCPYPLFCIPAVACSKSGSADRASSRSRSSDSRRRSRDVGDPGPSTVAAKRARATEAVAPGPVEDDLETLKKLSEERFWAAFSIWRREFLHDFNDFLGER